MRELLTVLEEECSGTARLVRKKGVVVIILSSIFSYEEFICAGGNVNMRGDSELRFGILEELKYQSDVYSTEIGVCVHDQVVTLTGHVPSFTKKRAAEDTVKRIHGVKAVANEIQVDPAVSNPNDSTIARSAVEAIESDPLLRGYGIVVVVNGGWVTLEGEVDWQYQKESAQNELTAINGVRGIINFLSVRERGMSPGALQGAP